MGLLSNVGIEGVDLIVCEDDGNGARHGQAICAVGMGGLGPEPMLKREEGRCGRHEQRREDAGAGLPCLSREREEDLVFAIQSRL